MKKFKNLVIGGIQNKIFNLILFTIILITAVYAGVFVYNNNLLTHLAVESVERQQTAISETTGGIMRQIINQTLERSNTTEAGLVNQQFKNIRNQVTLLSENAASLFAHPHSYSPTAVSAPDPENDGTWTVKVLYADGVDPSDPVVSRRTMLIGNLSDVMLSLYNSFGAEDAYIALPEGVFLCADSISSSWFEDGKLISYDPRERAWYQQAAEAGELIFTEGGWDANTGSYCVECASPVYGPDGALEAVVGMDLYLDDMQALLEASLTEGEYVLLVNEAGRAVFGPQAEAFPMSEADRGGDLRASSNAFLAEIAAQALKNSQVGVIEGELSDGVYYVASSTIDATGWALISAFSQAVLDRPTEMLTNSYMTIQQEVTDSYQSETSNARTTIILIMIAAVAAALVGALVLGKQIVKPLNTITKRISELKQGNLEFKMEKEYRTGDEVEELAQSFAAISHKTVEYMEQIVQVTAEKERIGAELTLATQIQAAMLPHIFPAFPDRPDFDIYASMDPAKEVGGDFYDYFLIDDDHLCMVIADVSGKGVPAALFMMASKIILQSVAMLGNSPAAILARTNEALCANNEAEMFVTTWLGILELSTGKLTAANAGHEYPCIQRPGESFELYKDRHGFVLGGMEGARYREYELQLEPGAKLFVYTDGVPEATSAEKELFGTDRMVEALNAHPKASPKDTLKNVRAAVDAFVKDAEQFDDLTMLCMEYKGQLVQGGESK